MLRRKTREVKIKNLIIGNDNPIYIQSMCTTKTFDIEKTVRQIKELEKAGCEIVRVSVPDKQSAIAIKEIKSQINIPLVADIHFDYKLAVLAIENGIDKLRINPGNIGSKQRVIELVNACKEKSIPIRIGVNGGSIEKDILEKYKKPCPDALVESALRHVKILEDENFFDIVISLKSSSVPQTIEAYEKISKLKDYPLHIGVTEAGTIDMGTVKSVAGLASALYMGIGDTFRVSLTSDPINEIKLAKQILQAMEIRYFFPEIISCPTCARTDIDIIKLAKEVEDGTKHIKKHIKIAVMGCIVNGPGEAKEADIGIAGGKNEAILFKKGKVIRKINEEDLLAELLKEIESGI